jgi:hypothetical protein
MLISIYETEHNLEVASRNDGSWVKIPTVLISTQAEIGGDPIKEPALHPPILPVDIEAK